MTESSITQYGSRDEIKELANRLQKMMPGASRFTESEALTVAQVAISHGLDPFNGEVWGIKYQKNGEWVWAGVMVGVKGLRKSARRQGNYWTEFRRVEPATYNAPASAVVWECHLRDTERVQAYGKSINTLTTSGVPYVEAIKMLGAAPVYIGVGIATPDEHSKMGLHARAKKRAEADAIKQAYDVQFGGAMMENGSVINGEVSVLGFDDDHALPSGDTEPRPAEQVLEELGYGAEPVNEDMLYDVDHYEIDDDGKVIIGGAVIGDAPKQPAFDLAPKSLMTYEMAIAEVGDDGIKYGDKDTSVLSHMANALIKKLKDNGISPEDRENKTRKLDAIKVILAHRQG
jgi:hypothetical protein